MLQVYDAEAAPREAGFTRVIVTEATHPYVEHWWPAGHGLGYEHGFTHQAADLIDAIARGVDPEPSFADGLAVQEVLAAVELSAAERSSWTPIDAVAADDAQQADGHRTCPPVLTAVPRRTSAPHPHDSGARRDDPTDHPLHRAVGRPAVRGGVPARGLLGLRRARDRLLG